MPQLDVADTATADIQDRVIPVLQETATIAKRLVTSDQAQVRITVSEHDQAIDALLMRQDLAITRVPVDKVVTEPPPVRREGDTLIVPVLEEVLVTEKRLVLREELHVRIQETTRTETQVVRLRREHADITRTHTPGDNP